jgi:hypothetical protein
LVKRIQVCSNKGSDPLQRGDNHCPIGSDGANGNEMHI